MLFYRIVKTDPPRLEDFFSYEELGLIPSGSDPEVLRRWTGISVYASKRQARRRALDRRRLGGFISTLNIPGDGSILCERTGTAFGHYTLWSDAARLQACVTNTEFIPGW